MQISYLQQWLTTPTYKIRRSQLIFWFSLSLTFSVIYSVLALELAFRGNYLIDSDARQHVFWMQRFLDPALFPDDLITDYHQSVAPSGYTALYWLIAQLGIPPLILNKFLPTLLGVITTSYCFGTCLQLLPVPAAGFIASLVLNQTLWMRYDLVSGTPRAFIYPLFLAFLYYLLRRSLLPCLIAIALQGLFYPQCVFISSGILVLQLWRWHKRRLCLSGNKQDYLFCVAGLGTALLVMLPYALQSSEFGAVITAAQAKISPEFSPGGRTPFFHNNFWEFWFYGKRSSLVPRLSRITPLIYTGLFLPFLLWKSSQFPLARQVTPKVQVLMQGFIASLGMFVIAHVFLFRLHHPSRYTMHSLLVLLALAAGITLTVSLQALFDWAKYSPKSYPWKGYLARGTTVFLAIVLIVYPVFTPFPYTKYKRGKEPLLYEFFSQQPKDIMIASLSEEANNIPSFAQRSVLTSEMYTIPYHVDYYNQIRQRTIDLIRAQYSADLTLAQNVIETYGADFWLLDRTAFTPEYIRGSNWLMQFSAARAVVTDLEQGIIPALSGIMEQCSVLETEYLVVLPTDCILKFAQKEQD